MANARVECPQIRKFVRRIGAKCLFFKINAPDCKSVYPSSILGSASTLPWPVAIVTTTRLTPPKISPNIQYCLSIQFWDYFRVGTTLILRSYV